MKRFFRLRSTTRLLLVLLAVLSSCGKSPDEEAAAAVARIDSLYEAGLYREALDSITQLREYHPRAVKARQHALKIWQEASLKMAQEEIASTDSSLQATLDLIEKEQDLYKANMLRVKRDSLKARYEAMCGVVRMIHVRQQEDQSKQ